MIEFHDVRRTYGQKVAVAGLSLVVPAGELFAFLGPNGAGKTTTIKMLVGLLRPSGGAISVCGHDVVERPRDAQSLMGYVPDEPYLYDKLSGREFLQFIADMYALPRDIAAQRLIRETGNFALAGFLDDLTETYSHGMKQRLAFAAALLHDPPVLVLDEPTVGLDPRSVWMLKDLLRQRARAGTTIFMSTHSLALAEEIADRIGIVDQGRLRFLGTLADLRRELSQHERSLEHLYLQLTSGAEDSTVQSAPA